MRAQADLTSGNPLDSHLRDGEASAIPLMQFTGIRKVAAPHDAAKWIPPDIEKYHLPLRRDDRFDLNRRHTCATSFRMTRRTLCAPGCSWRSAWSFTQTTWRARERRLCNSLSPQYAGQLLAILGRSVVNILKATCKRLRRVD